MVGNFILPVLIFSLAGVLSVSFEEDTRLTVKQGEILNKFRQRVLPKLPKKYMEENIFLVRWLRARNFDIDRAEEMLKKNLKWRQENNLDRIDNENWGDFESEYPWTLTGSDKNGRPIAEMIVREWDLRKGMLAGFRDKLTRWTYKMFEDGTKLVRKRQESGKNVTQFTMIVDTEGFNPITHGCALCIPYFLTMASVYEEQYPGCLDKIHIVNTPEYFRVILRLMWPIFTESTRKAMKVHGTDRRVWKKILSEDIDDNQLLQNFGGKREFR